MLQCPLCKQSLHFSNGGSLVCENRHCFDISSKGYVNFVLNQKPSKGYGKLFFESRRKFLQAGFYDHIANAIGEIITEHGNGLHIIDAGCGEGFYTLKLAEQTDATIFAFDYSKDAIKIASRGGNDVYWMVADIANIPLKNSRVDCILNIYTPANYTEFRRVLSSNGVLVKVIPGANHLRELRQAVRSQLRNEEYSNQQVVDYFNQHFELVERKIINQTIPLRKAQLQSLLEMTPLMFGVDAEKVDFSNITHITIEAEILLGGLLSPLG
mgnify:CR=1 FL=1